MPTNKKQKKLVIYLLDKKQLEMAISNPSPAKAPAPTVVTGRAVYQSLLLFPFISQYWEGGPTAAPG